MGPIRAQSWLPSAPLASWTRRNWRERQTARPYRPHPALGDLFVIWTTSPVSLSQIHDNRTPYAVEVAGGGRSSAINRRMSAKRFFRNGDLGNLECNVATRADDLGANLDQLLLQAGQRPIIDRLRRRQRAHPRQEWDRRLLFVQVCRPVIGLTFSSCAPVAHVI
jgi:hypothetical protein